jgi:hypothetical protein
MDDLLALHIHIVPEEDARFRGDLEQAPVKQSSGLQLAPGNIRKRQPHQSDLFGIQLARTPSARRNLELSDKGFRLPADKRKH